METIQFRLNDKPVSLREDGDRMLLWVLRTDLGITGPKYGCGQEQCGACTVLVNHEAVLSCQTPVREVEGKDVLTIEGLAGNGTLHPLQKSFIEHDALQCGFCTPGMILKTTPSRPGMTSFRGWRGTSAAADPTRGSYRRFKRPRNK